MVGAKAGLDVERLLEVVEAGTGSSYSLNVLRYVIFRGNFDPAKFARGAKFIDHEQVDAWLSSWGTPRERKAPL